jgi:hypothetical protein
MWDSLTYPEIILMFIYTLLFAPQLMLHYWYFTIVSVAVGGFFSFYKLYFFFAVGFKKRPEFQFLFEKRGSWRYRCILYGFILAFIGYWLLFFLWLMFGYNPVAHI